MSKKTAKQRVIAIHNCLLQNKKIKTISELAKILKISTIVPRMLKDETILMYNAFGKVIWNANVPYTAELEERIYNKTLEYAKQSEARCKETAKVKAEQSITTVTLDEAPIEFVKNDEVEIIDVVKEVKLESLILSINSLHEKIDALGLKVLNLQVTRPRTKMMVTPSTNVSSKHNFFGEDL
jgi:hypothetical protein